MLSPFFGKGRNVKTRSITGFLLLYLLAKFTRFRRGTYRFSKRTNRADIVCKLQRAALTDEKGLRFKEALAE